MADSPQLAQALKYAAHGWPVFPVVPGEKIPVTPHGFKDATTDPARIRAWWSSNSGRNIGIATGRPGPDVVDVDNHGTAGNGFAAWNQAKRAGAATARPIILRQIEAGHSAEQIADRWEGALATHDPQTATPEQQAWHDGAESEARQLIQDWRDMQRSEAELAQAARDERQAAQDAEDRQASAAGDAGEQLAGEPSRISERELNDMESAHPEPEPSPEPEGPWYLSEEREPEAGSAPEHDLEAAG